MNPSPQLLALKEFEEPLFGQFVLSSCKLIKVLFKFLGEEVKSTTVDDCESSSLFLSVVADSLRTS